LESSQPRQSQVYRYPLLPWKWVGFSSKNNSLLRSEAIRANERYLLSWFSQGFYYKCTVGKWKHYVMSERDKYCSKQFSLDICRRIQAKGSKSYFGPQNVNKLTTYKVGDIKHDDRVMAFIIGWILSLKTRNHAQLTTKDIFLIFVHDTDQLGRTCPWYYSKGHQITHVPTAIWAVLVQSIWILQIGLCRRKLHCPKPQQVNWSQRSPLYEYISVWQWVGFQRWTP